MKLTYKETTDYLFHLLPMYQRSGTKAFKKDLSNIKSLCSVLDQPHETYDSIHIAGTNGKGTVSHIVAAILQAMGLKVGIYTSPHYIDFRERIKVNGQLVSEDYIIGWVAAQRSLILEVQPSFFEVTVAMAFDYFRAEEVDIAVIETGLGGRLDSTNIIKPVLSVITNISYDHQSILGDTLYEIAGEKAGIIKPRTPVVIGRYQSSCDQVFIQKSINEKSTLTWASLKWKAMIEEGQCRFSSLKRTISVDWHLNESPFLQENIITALEAIQSYVQKEDIPWDQKTIEKGIKNFRKLTNYIGRWQVLQEAPLMIADSAHNEDGLRKVLAKVMTITKDIHFVIGFVKDKDLDKILALFPRDATYYFVNARIERAIHSTQLAKYAKKWGLVGRAYSSISEGMAEARIAATEDAVIYVGGSSFVVGDVMDIME